MRVDPEGRLVCVRGRQIHMTPADVADFLVTLAQAISEARYFDRTKIDEGRMPELSRTAPEIPGGPFPEVKMIFQTEPWEPEIVPSNLEWRNYMLANGPQLHASIRPSSFGYSTIKGVGRKITRSTSGLLYANYFADDREGKRIINKMFRIHRKMVDNRAVAVDLRTGKVVDEERLYDWYGRDFATQCRMKKDHYIQVVILPDQDIFWGYLPAI